MDENKAFSEQEPDGEFGRLFRTTFRGFNRQDVVEYIARLTRDREREKESAGIRIRELEENRDLLTIDLTTARKYNADLTAQLYQAKAQVEYAQAELAQEKADEAQRLENATQTLAAQCAEKDKRIDALAQEAALSRQLLLAARAEIAILEQQAKVSAYAAALYAAQCIKPDKPAAPVQVQQISRAKLQKFAQPLQKTDKQLPVSASTGLSTQPAKPAATEKPAAAARTGTIARTVQTVKENAEKHVGSEKKWVNTLLSKILND